MAVNRFTAILQTPDIKSPALFSLSVNIPTSSGAVAHFTELGDTVEEVCARAAFTIPGQQHAVFRHGAETYEVYRTEQVDTDRFPAVWPQVGWYWERGVPSTTLIYGRRGPFDTAVAAYLDVLTQEMRSK